MFDKTGVCNACQYKKENIKIDYEKREEELRKILKKNKVKGSKYDCVVPWSGGKDSSYVAYQLKFKYGVNPLLVTFSPLIPSQVGQHNRKEMIKLGFDHIIVTPNEKISSYFAFRLLLLFWTATIFYHMFNGIRFLFWSFSLGMELGTVYKSGYVVLGLTIISTFIVWYY